MSLVRQFVSKLGITTKAIRKVANTPAAYHSDPQIRCFSSQTTGPLTASLHQAFLLKVSTPCLITQLRHCQGDRAPRDYTPPSPYRIPRQRRYGYSTKLFTGGVLPRPVGSERISCILNYKNKEPWKEKKALFGQNDYIDILGDGNIKPSSLLKGPRWLLGFRGNELQRLTRRVRFQTQKLKSLTPSKHTNIKKRIKYLYKSMNYTRQRKYY